MPGRRRGRTGRGWDAAPPRAPRPKAGADPAERSPQRDPAEVAREICLRQLAVRPRTRAELAATLRARGIEERVAAEVLDRYDEVGMIDDAAFARAWVTSRHHGRGLAGRALSSELRRRGVAAETVGEALAELDQETEAATARALVDRQVRRLLSGPAVRSGPGQGDRKLRTASGAPEAIVRRLVGMLARKGYPAGLAYRVVKEAMAADERTAELADRLDPDALADAADED